MTSDLIADNQVNWRWWIEQIHPHPCILIKYGLTDFILAWEWDDVYCVSDDDFSFSHLEKFLEKHQGDFVFGSLIYDLKNHIESRLASLHEDKLQFPAAHFFTAKKVLVVKNGDVNFYGEDKLEEAMRNLMNRSERVETKNQSVELIPLTSKEEYIKNVREIQREIQYGNIYEMNYCVAFQQEQKQLNTVETFVKLDELSDAPFSVYFDSGDHAVMCASPERYIKKNGSQLISQPIKGTARRGSSLKEDETIQKNLFNDPKERSENIMIVDLVRNDLSKIAAKNSVEVAELCGVYSFKTVHQLISTVGCTVDKNVSFSEIIRATFPMGSMTGAPKISAMQLAERYENFKRGLYSGSIGCITPDGDFDFNVVIRSILYNRKRNVVSCAVGGAITINSVPEKEYEECLLKLNALKRALESSPKKVRQG